MNEEMQNFCFCIKDNGTLFRLNGRNGIPASLLQFCKQNSDTVFGLNLQAVKRQLHN